jgi:hypothetical protein
VSGAPRRIRCSAKIGTNVGGRKAAGAARKVSSSLGIQILLDPSRSDCWVLMITSAANARWPEDVEIDDHEGAGLPIASVVRTAKIAIFEARAASRLGTISERNAAHVATILRRGLS